MRIGVKDFKKAYKHVNIDDIEVSFTMARNIKLFILTLIRTH